MQISKIRKSSESEKNQSTKAITVQSTSFK